MKLGAGAFSFTLLFVGIKLMLLSSGSGWAETFGLLAAVLPAFAAAFFGVRAYAELDLLVQHSERMLGVLEGASVSLERTDSERAGRASSSGTCWRRRRRRCWRMWRGGSRYRA